MKCFDRERKARFPEFEPFDSDPTLKQWSWKVAPKLVFFVMVQAFSDCDKFAIEVAWSKNGEFPWGAFGRMEVDEKEGRGRVSRFWRSGPDEPVWDAAPEKTAAMEQRMIDLDEDRELTDPVDPPLAETVKCIAPLVADAADKFLQYGMPLFRRVADAQGV
ncbi:MAG: hypothetical protein NVSMB68_14830 [Thermoanaerobaculia bacterium]